MRPHRRPARAAGARRVAVVFNDGAFGNVRPIQAERYGNRIIASDLSNPDFVLFTESFGARAERAKDPAGLRTALRRSFARRDGPTSSKCPSARCLRRGSSSTCRGRGGEIRRDPGALRN